MTPDLVPISTVSRINTLVSCISIIIRPVWTGAPSSPIDTWGGISHKHTRARSTRPLSRVRWRARSSSAKYGHWKWNPSLAQFAGWRARAVASSCSVHYVMLCASYDMIPETKTYAICITTTVIYYDRYIYVIDWTFQFCTLFAHFTFANWQSMQSIILMSSKCACACRNLSAKHKCVINHATMCAQWADTRAHVAHRCVLMYVFHFPDAGVLWGAIDTHT